MCDEFFTEHSSVEDETITLSLETWVTNHSLTWRTTPTEAESSSAPPRELKNSHFYLYSEQQRRLSLNRVALRETKLQVVDDDDDDDDDDDEDDDDGNDR